MSFLGKVFIASNVSSTARDTIVLSTPSSLLGTSPGYKILSKVTICGVNSLGIRTVLGHLYQTRRSIGE